MSERWSLVGFRLGVIAAAWLPDWLAALGCALVGRLAPGLPGWSAVLANLAVVAPTANDRARRALARRLYAAAAWSYWELWGAATVPPAALRRRFVFVGRKRLAAAVASGRGVVVVAPHLGGFSLVPRAAALDGFPSTVVMERLQPPALYRLVASLRGGPGVTVVPAGLAGLRTVLATLRRGGIVVLAADRDISGTGITVPFFGRPARLPDGPARLAQRTGAILLPMATQRLAGRRALVTVGEPIRPATAEDAEQAIAQTTAQVAAALATAIRQAPEQWAILQPIW